MIEKNTMQTRRLKKLSLFLSSKTFDHFTMALIALNAILFGLQISDIGKDQVVLLALLDRAFLTFFVLEMLVKVFVFTPSKFFKDGWHCFDFIVIFLSALAFQDMFKFLRVLRILRLFVLLDFIPKAHFILRTITHAIPGMVHTFVFGFIIFYVWTLVGCQIFQGASAEAFGHISATMWTLFKVMTFDGWGELVEGKILPVYPQGWIFFLFYIMTMSMIVLNLCIGVIVDAISTAAAADPTRKPDPIMVKLKEIQHDVNKGSGTIPRAIASVKNNLQRQQKLF